MATVGIFLCPHCGKAPAYGTDANCNPIFVCCPLGGERSIDDVTKLPVKQVDPSDPNAMPVIRP